MRKLSISGWLMLVLFLVTAGCQPAEVSPAPVQPTGTPQPAATQPPPPTATPLPTETSVPTVTPTATIEPTATPEYLIFRDDFNGAIRPEWTWENENKERWTISPDGWLQIIGEDAGLLAGKQQSNLLWTDLPDSTFSIVVHLKATPSDNFAQAAIYLYENIDNYVTINRGYCNICPTGGDGVYMDYKVNGQFGDYWVSFSESDLYLKLEDKDGIITGYYSTAPDQWQRLGRFGNYFKFTRVGLGVTNLDVSGSTNNDVVGFYDFFEIRKP